MRIDILELRENIFDHKSCWYISVPYEDYDSLNKTLAEVECNCIWFSFEEGNIAIDFEYSKNGIKFNPYSDWSISINGNGVMKGKGAIRFRPEILNAVNWFVESINSKNFDAFLNSP